jgi:hypothetical protein
MSGSASHLKVAVHRNKEIAMLAHRRPTCVSRRMSEELVYPAF